MENEFNPWKVTSLEDFTMIVYSCPECERIFSTSEQFIGHAMMSHPKARATLPDILNVQDNVPEEKSEITEKSLENQDFVEVKQESELECTEMYQCDLCPVFFNSEGDLMKHKSEGHRCEFCVFTFHTVEAKLKHMRRTHNYQCDKCDQNFPLKKDLKSHECQALIGVESCDQIHPTFKCNICDKSFHTKEGRNQHIKSNAKTCKQLQKSNYLKSHKRKHQHHDCQEWPDPYKNFLKQLKTH